MKRSYILPAILAAAILILVVRWLFSPPVYSFDFVNAPLSRVLAQIEKKTKITIRSNLPPDTPVTLQVRRAPLPEVLDLLAVRADAALRLTYVIAPDRTTLREGIELVGAPADQRTGWQSFWFPVEPWLLPSEAFDFRDLKWQVEKMESSLLANYLSQGAQKLPVQFFVPEPMAQQSVKVPASGKPANVIASMLKPLRGEFREVFFLTGGGGGMRGFGITGDFSGRERPELSRPPSRTGEGATNFAGERSGAGEIPLPQTNPDWIKERTENLIAAMPPEEQTQAREFAREIEGIREKLAGLEGDARREAAREIFSSPRMQERMEEAMSVRDAKRTPEQREARYRRVAERRIEAREQSGNPLVARP